MAGARPTPGLIALMMICATGMAALAQQPQAQPAAAPADPGKEMLLGKCFQCHTDSMWRDQRQDARAWEATLYRMMGRGALWTGDEIKTMAAYLGADFGPNAKPLGQQGK